MSARSAVRVTLHDYKPLQNGGAFKFNSIPDGVFAGHY